MLKYSKDNLSKIASESKSITEMLIKLGLRNAGGNFRTISKYIKLFELDITHFEEYKKERYKNLYRKEEIPLTDCLVENSTISRSSLKSKLYKSGIKAEICEICGQGNVWNGKKISLILDHINGVFNDNRIENLRIVCPNCNATLDTHCGKNINLKKLKPIRDENNLTNKQKLSFDSKRKLKITKSELNRLVQIMPVIHIAKMYNVSDVLIHKYCKRWGIDKFKAGYWNIKTKY